MTDNYFLEAADGSPLGMIDFDLITDAGCSMAFRMAAHCDDPIALDAIAADILTEVGEGAFGYVAVSALRILAEQILSPALTAGEAAGVHLRDGLLALSEGRDPMTTVRENHR
ncbi:MAG: hypothetical protein QOH56_861 [Pseudonocardiales bacterium]|jgi:hypothetical protein|nr:hypothetical protein [Pseudonocardiales bacterium]